MNQIFLETRMFRLSGGEEIMTLAFFILIQYRSVTDGQTDRQTDIPPLAILLLAVCIARYANALVKIRFNAERQNLPLRSHALFEAPQVPRGMERVWGGGVPLPSGGRVWGKFF